MPFVCTASAAEAAAQRKERNYVDISRFHLRFPLTIETLGSINRDWQDFIDELGHRMSPITEDPRETERVADDHNIFL
jgi:hypothetical protein